MKIYLAGPDVFRSNATDHFNKLLKIVEEFGFVGLSPMDNVISIHEKDRNTQKHADMIFEANVRLMDEADVIMANIIPFRGTCMDDGTAFEIGYGFAKGKLLYGYAPDCDSPLKNRTVRHLSREFPEMEDYNYSTNLMICSSIKSRGGLVFPNIKGCLSHLKDNF